MVTTSDSRTSRAARHARRPGGRLRTRSAGPGRGVAGGDRPLRRKRLRRGLRPRGVRRRDRRRRRRFRRQGRQGLGRRGRGAHRQRRSRPRQGFARRGPQGASLGRRPARLRARRRRPVRHHVHRDGRADGRAGHRPARHRAPRGRPARGRARARRTHARRSRPSWSPRTSPRPTPPDSSRRSCVALVTERGGPTSHTAIIARQLGIPCVVGTAGAMEIAAGTRLLVDGTAGTVELDPDEAEAAAPGGRGRRDPCGAGDVGRAGRDGRRHAGQDPGQRRRRRVAPGPRPAPRSRGSGCSAPSCASSNRKEEPTVEEQADDLRRGARRRSAARTGTSWSARWTPAPTSRWPSRPSRARRTPPSASAACGCRSATPACSTASSTRSPRRRARPAPRPG